MTCLALDIQCAGYGERPAWLDGGEREKKKAEEFEAGLHDRSRYKRRRYSSQSANVRSWTPRQSTSSLPEGVGDGADFPIMLPTPDEENAPTGNRCVEPMAEDLDLHVSMPGSITVSGDPFWSATPYEISQANRVQSELDPVTTSTSLEFDFDSRRARSPWYLFPDSDISAAFPPIAEPSPNLGRNLVGSPSVDHAGTFEQSFGTIVDLRWSNQSVVSDEPHMTYYVNYVIPSLFPFLGPQLQATLRNKFLTSDAVIRSCTLAHCLVLQKFGLERIGLNTSGEEAADRQRHEAMGQVRSMLRHMNNDQAQSGDARDTDMALCVLQMVLLQVSAKSDETV